MGEEGKMGKHGIIGLDGSSSWALGIIVKIWFTRRGGESCSSLLGSRSLVGSI